jgi:4-diphosphocytidyl-2-C-methyl-D-erythritol kinase
VDDAPRIEKAYAKINLCLEILGKRQDNYHDITSVMQMVDLYDTLTFEAANDLRLDCDDPALAAEGDDNLVLKAARLLREEAGVSAGAHIRLEKRIPMAAGLGGGSSDAAAALRGLAELWGLRPGKGDLASLAIRLGSDVPFFLDGPTAFVEGRGERVTHIPSPPAGWAVLVCPVYDLKDKTKQLYGNLTRQDMSEGMATHQLIAALIRGEFPGSNLLYNAFERTAYGIFDGLERLRQTMQRTSGRDAHLSGSGPTLYTLFPGSQESLAQRFHERLESAGLRTYVVRTLR